jgi:PAS domain S-box-containing protein
VTDQPQVSSNPEESLRHELARLQALAEYAMDALFLLDENGVISFVNSSAETIFGWPREELRGRVLHDLLHHHRKDGTPYPAEDCPLVRAVREGRTIRRHEDVFFHRGGTRIQVVCTSGPIHREGEPPVAAMVVRDVSSRKQSERALAESEARLALALGNTPITLFSQDLDLRYTWIHNPALGLSEEQVLGATDYDLFPEDSARCLESFKRRAMEEGIGLRERVRIGSGRNARAFDLSVEPRRASDGRIEGVDGVAVDVTASTRLEDDRRFLLDLTERILPMRDPDAVLAESIAMLGRHLGAARCSYSEVYEEEDRIVVRQDYCDGVPSTRGEHRISDYGEAQPLLRGGTPVRVDDTAVHPVTAAFYESRLRALGIRAAIVVPLIKEGSWVATFSVHRGEPTEWSQEDVHLLQTVADRVWQAIIRARAETELRHLNEELESRVDARTEELQGAYQEMESFTYSVSHDLRAPLRSIMSTSMILMEDYAESLPEDAREELQRQAQAAKRLATLIDDILKLSRVGRQEAQTQEVNLSKVARESGEDVLAAYTDRVIRLEVEPGLRAMGDPHLLRLLMDNLIGNAVKFSPGGGTVLVAMQPDGTYLVRDEGIGFDMEYAEKVFRPFERLVREQDFPGTGVGLASVSRIVQKHGGKIWAESASGQGATFFFRLGDSGPSGH